MKTRTAFRANFFGRCPECLEPIKGDPHGDGGDLCVFSEDGQVIHQGCAAEPDVQPERPAKPGRPSRVRGACGLCHLIHAGECW